MTKRNKIKYKMDSKRQKMTKKKTLKDTKWQKKDRFDRFVKNGQKSFQNITVTHSDHEEYFTIIFRG